MKWNESKIKRARERENEWETIVCEYNMCRLDSIGMNSRHKSHLLVFVWALHMLWLRFCVCAFSVSLLPTTKLTKRLSVHSYSPSWFYTHTHTWRIDQIKKHPANTRRHTQAQGTHRRKERERRACILAHNTHTHTQTFWANSLILLLYSYFMTGEFSFVFWFNPIWLLLRLLLLCGIHFP